MTRVVGYVRVSSADQANSGFSLDAQRAKLAAYALAMDLTLVNLHVDAGVSAKNMKRAGLQAALRDLDEGRASGLLIVKLDRLTRSVRDLATLLERYFEKRFALLSVGDSLDTRSASGRLVLNLLTSVAEWERQATSERTSQVLQHLRRQGVRLGGAAIGWTRTTDLDADGRQVVAVVDAEVQTVERIRNSVRMVSRFEGSRQHSRPRAMRPNAAAGGVRRSFAPSYNEPGESQLRSSFGSV